MVDSKPLFTGEEWDDIYALPPNALKVWLFHYRCEIDGRESWPGEDLICYKLRICRDTLADNRKWLKTHGWLVQLTEAYRGHNPTFRVERGWLADSHATDDPLSNNSNRSDAPGKSRRSEVPKQRKKADTFNASVKMRRKNTDAKVCCSSSPVLSSRSALPSCHSGVESQVAKAEEEGRTEERTENPKPITRRCAKDGTEVPLDNGTGGGPKSKPKTQAAAAATRMQQFPGDPECGHLPSDAELRSMEDRLLRCTDCGRMAGDKTVQPCFECPDA
jgi:hypothetical protein